MTTDSAPLTALTQDAELEYLSSDCGHTLAWYVRGHVSDDAFVAAYEDWHGAPPKHRTIAREWWRWVPASAAERYEYGWASRRTSARPQSRGAFKVTVLWVP